MEDNNSNTNNIKETYILGFSGIVKVAGLKKILKNKMSLISFLLSIVFIVLIYILKIDPYIILKEITSNIINVIPSILGFTISAYALVVGFVHSEIMEKIVTPMRNSKFSLYQKMSSTFALNIIFQALALIIGFFAHYVLYFDSILKVSMNVFIQNLINYFGLWLIFLSFTISLLLTIQVVINIFDFSQLYHYFVLTKKKQNQSDTSVK